LENPAAPSTEAPSIGTRIAAAPKVLENHFDLGDGVAMEGTVNSECLFQLIHAKATHNPLQVAANDKATYPNGRESIRITGLKTKATASKAAVVVYRVPAYFCWLSNMQPPRLPDVPKRKGRTA
jgi:hypothetical protein